MVPGRSRQISVKDVRRGENITYERIDASSPLMATGSKTSLTVSAGLLCGQRAHALCTVRAVEINLDADIVSFREDKIRK